MESRGLNIRSEIVLVGVGGLALGAVAGWLLCCWSPSSPAWLQGRLASHLSDRNEASQAYSLVSQAARGLRDQVSELERDNAVLALRLLDLAPRSLEPSMIVFGGIHIGPARTPDRKGWILGSQEQADATVKAAIDGGIRDFDTAPM